MDLDDHVRGASPLWNVWNVVAKGGVVHFVNENTEESGGLFIRIRLELGVDLDDEGRSHGGEQTGLPPKLARAHSSNAQDSQISGWCLGPRRASL